MSKSLLLGLFKDSLHYADFFHAAIIFVLGIIIARIASAVVFHLLSHYSHHKHQHSLARRITFYATFALFTCSALLELGFDLHLLLGAAGILTIALGFASQMSASNLISGLFLVGERAYKTGDTLSVNGVTGDVISIDLLSIKLKTPENTFIRIPNEVLIKTQLTNLTHFPIRRLDITLTISYQENFIRVRHILSEVVRYNLLCLKDPAPKVVFQDFENNMIHFRFSIWTNKQHYTELKESIVEQIKEAFDKHQIISPIPHQVVLTSPEIPSTKHTAAITTVTE